MDFDETNDADAMKDADAMIVGILENEYMRTTADKRDAEAKESFLRTRLDGIRNEIKRRINFAEIDGILAQQVTEASRTSLEVKEVEARVNFLQRRIDGIRAELVRRVRPGSAQYAFVKALNALETL